MSVTIKNPRARYRLAHSDALPPVDGTLWHIEDRHTSTLTPFDTFAAAAAAVEALIRTDNIELIERVRDQWSGWVREHRAHKTVTEEAAWAMDLAVGCLSGVLTGATEEGAIGDIARLLAFHQPGFVNGNLGCTGCAWAPPHPSCDQHIAHSADNVTQYILNADLTHLIGDL